MIDLHKFEKIASELEAKLGIVAEEESLQTEIEERTEEEKKEIEVPTPSVEASTEETVEANEEEVEMDAKEFATARIAHLTRLVKLAKTVKKSKKLSAEEKQEALNKIEKVAASNDLKIKKTDLNKMLTNDVTRIMKTTSKLNSLTQAEKGVTLKEALKEMKAWGKEHDVKVDFPENILNKTIGSCNAEWLIKLGPMIATLIQKFETMKEDAEKKVEKE
jgi:hypothetical protein